MRETVRETQHEGQEGAGTDSAARILSQGTTQAQHVARGVEHVTGHWSHVSLYRVGCTCGYKGCWYREPSNARDAFRRHADRQGVEFR
jgi:hypothetical protein